MQPIPRSRIRLLNSAPVCPEGKYVLYWMTSARRLDWNFALQHACIRARELGLPLVILEAIQLGYPNASRRIHQFLVAGMLEHERRLQRSPVHYYPYIEPHQDAQQGLLRTLARKAACVVADEFPCYFLRDIVPRAGQQLRVKCEAVDSNGFLPIREPGRGFLRAVDYRRYLQKLLSRAWPDIPEPHPLARVRLDRAANDLIPPDVRRRWPTMPTSRQEIMRALDNLPIDQTIHAAPMKGGSKQAKRTLTRFVADRLPQYHTKRNDLNEDASSGLSPWLHFGHISTHEILSHVLPTNPSPDFETIRGQREGWWRLSPGTEAFLDQLLVWRELGFNGCTWIPDFERYDSLPSWALQTLQQHAGDPRSYLYTYEQFRDGQTHDALWNAAQQQLVREGRMHNYLRMLWGKKILEWSPDARRAFNTMLEINNRYALDGRDPNSWSGIAWVLGRYDRAWGPERPIFGKVRYMSSKNTARKYRTTDYVARYTTQSTAPSI